MSTEHPVRLLVAAGLVWLGQTTILLQRRARDAAHGAGALEFPGGKVEPGEHPAAALRRELSEEWGEGAAALVVGPVAEILHHVYPAPGPEVVLCLYHVDGRVWGDGWATRIVLEPGVEGLAVAQARVPLDEFLAADRPFAARLAQGAVACPFLDNGSDGG